MNTYLVSALETKDRVDLLISLTNIRSENIISALHDHLVVGATLKHASWVHDVDVNNLKRSLAKLNKVAGIVERIKEIDWHKSTT